ncbi:MAG: AgmX/PglI C-terminal domain-containing protein [Myxococcota bacterium]|nr:AgmX/PglI C-terminal domain-containing protein [Myxococcota bacterium]
MAFVRVAPLAWCAAEMLACGATQSRGDEPRAPVHADSPTPSGSDEQVVGAATTTTTLSDARESSAQKLNETHPTTSSASVGSAARTADHAARAGDPGRTADDIRAIVLAHRDEARACYDQALPAHPGVEGNLILQWTIDPKGNVTEVSADASRSQIAEPSIIRCIAERIKRIQFAASPGGFETKARYPFSFHPRHNTRSPP